MVGFQELSLTAAAGEMILQDICHNICITANISPRRRKWQMPLSLWWGQCNKLTWKCRFSCMFQLPGGWPGESGTMMEGGMQLLNRDGHSISHNSKRHYHDSFVSMNRMRQRGLLCDIVLHVSNKEIKAHKVVLASCSPYFHAMFTSKLGLWIALLASCFYTEFTRQQLWLIFPSSCPLWGPCRLLNSVDVMSGYFSFA